jgi:hypothetical protein
VLSLLEYSSVLGSFLEIQKWVYEKWDKLLKEHPSEIKYIERRLDDFLNYEDIEFKRDPTAKLVKIFFNKDFLIPAVVIKDILRETHSIVEAIQYLQRIIEYQKNEHIINQQRYYARISIKNTLRLHPQSVFEDLSNRYFIKDYSLIESAEFRDDHYRALFEVFEKEMVQSYTKKEIEEFLKEEKFHTSIN